MSRVPKEVLEKFYKIGLPERTHVKYTAFTLLALIAMKKGWISQNSNPNVAQAARLVLIDYTTGSLVFCHLRPDYKVETHGKIIQSGFNLLSITEKDLDPVQEAMREAELENMTIDSQAQTSVGGAQA